MGFILPLLILPLAPGSSSWLLWCQPARQLQQLQAIWNEEYKYIQVFRYFIIIIQIA